MEIEFKLCNCNFQPTYSSDIHLTSTLTVVKQMHGIYTRLRI